MRRYAFLIILVVMMMVAVPVAYSVGLAGLASMVFGSGLKLGTVGQTTLGGINSFPLIAVPLFMFAGKMMNKGGITDRLFGFANTLVGWLPGGLGHVNVVASFIFAGMSGSAVGDITSLGAIELKAMRDAGYDDEFSCSITTSSAILGPMIPPSIPAVVFATASGASVGACFLAGIVPGILLAVTLMVMVTVFTIIRKYPRGKFPSLRGAAKSFIRAIPSMFTVIIILIGIYTGFFTPTEAAAIAVLYSAFLGIVVYKEVKLKDLYGMLLDTVKDAASVMMIIACAKLLGSMVVKALIPQMVTEMLLSTFSSKFGIMLSINIFLLIIGMFMDATAATTILVPILLPVVMSLGISPVQFGQIFGLNMGIGTLTPPFGILVFTMSRVSGVPVGRLFKAAVPWMIAVAVVLALICTVPFFSTWLPELAGFSVW